MGNIESLEQWSSIEKIKDVKHLLKIIETEDNIYFRQAAVNNITDNQILIDIANRYEELHSNVVLNKNFKDEELLLKIALTSENWCTRMYAINNPNFNNIEALSLMTEDVAFPVSEAAKKKLKCLKRKETKP